ncbi:MAG: TetR/AcrR family transcriptional regulator [Lachnospiraceae bacterium]|nr:TetR/AcrR family transcriptional regulator [Lachnospiraceae bacterium]
MGIKQRRTDQDIIQERAVRTREKILAAALKMYTEKGYHDTTVDEIAKRAGLSTGIAYRYFKNKKELLLAALSFAFENIKELAGVSERELYDKDIKHILTAFEKIHTRYRDFHEELEGLRHSDSDVKKLYDSFAQNALLALYDKLPVEIKEKPHSWEKLNITIGLMENYCHAYMDKAFKKKELLFMREEVIRMAGSLLWEV